MVAAGAGYGPDAIAVAPLPAGDAPPMSTFVRPVLTRLAEGVEMGAGGVAVEESIRLQEHEGIHIDALCRELCTR